MAAAAALFVDTLYCSEETYEDDNNNEEESFNFYTTRNQTTLLPVSLDQQDMFYDDNELNTLLSKQQHNPLFNNTSLEEEVVEEEEEEEEEEEKNQSFSLLLSQARNEAIDWILKVHTHYSFKPLTALFAVNYFDRFLFSINFHKDKPWMTQLLAVACLSLAAKVEETQVPLLLDLQVEDSKYVFEAKTIQRMEMLVLSTLEWRMNPVTPIQFLDYIARRLGLKDYLCWEFIKGCDKILLSVISDARFMSYLPSVMATATMLHIINGFEDRIDSDYQDQLLGILRIDKDNVEECCKFLREVALSSGHGGNHKRKFGSVPGSPNGVMDVSFYSDSSNDSWAVTSATSSVCSSPEPLLKKNRVLNEERLSNVVPADFLSIPH